MKLLLTQQHNGRVSYRTKLADAEKWRAASNLVVIQCDLVAHGMGLAGEHVARLDFPGFKAVVRVHPNLPIAHVGSAGRADTGLARERKLDSLHRRGVDDAASP